MTRWRGMPRRRFLEAGVAMAGWVGAGCPSPQAMPDTGARMRDTASPLDGGTPPGDAAVPGRSLGVLKVFGALSGMLPYSATVAPLEGQVPAGQVLASEDDPSMSTSVLSRHGDGSARLVVVSGQVMVQAQVESELRLSLATRAEPVLAADAIAALLRSVRAEFEGLGTVEITRFEMPEKVWWANARSLCVRYRAVVSGSSLAIVVDVQAWVGGRALVEVLVENGLVDAAASSATAPEPAVYTRGVVSVNGEAIGSAESTGAPEGAHAPFRAWYARGWVGGDPQLRVVQDHADLQAHPLLFEVAEPSSLDLSDYASDAYSPWSTGRHRATAMGAAGDHPSIGPLPQWEARTLQTGDPRAWNATEVSALALLGYGVQHRDRATGLVPTFATIGAKGFASRNGWPGIYGPGDAGQGGQMSYRPSHGPAAGLMAFLGRPSPVFIELAQKIAVFNGTWSGSGNHIPWTSGTFGYWYNVRGRAWGLRSLAHAMFLTPEGEPWREACGVAIRNNVTYLDTFRNDPKATLNTLWDGTPDTPSDEGAGAGVQLSLWQQHYLMVELHKAASARLLVGEAQQALEELADWLCLQPIRFVNEQPNGGWRYIPYKTTVGDAVANAIGSGPTWSSSRNYRDAPAERSGPWMSNGGAPASYGEYGPDGIAGAYYPSYFWSALVAARERGLPGASEAYLAVITGITDLAAWKRGFASDPRWGASPRTS